MKKLIYSQEDLDLILSLKTQEYEDKINNLQSKIDKAIEYIENTDDFDIEIFDESTGGCLGYDLSKGAKKLLSILKGDK